jgi:hypothetical protein
VIAVAEGIRESRVGIGQRRVRIDVDRRADLGGDPRERDVFDVELTVLLVVVAHFGGGTASAGTGRPGSGVTTASGGGAGGLAVSFAAGR